MKPVTSFAKGTILSLLLTICAAFTGCSDKAEELVPQGTRALDVQVKVQPTSRAMVKGTALAEGAGLGVNVTATDGGLYDGKDAGYLNILYTASGTGANQEWNSTTPVMLSGTEGKMYAYYPHTPGVDFKAISVDITTQHDWMYGAEAYTVSDKAATAAVVLKHAQTAVNVNVVRDATYTGVGAVSALTVTSEGLASGGTLDTRDGSWSALSGANTAISIISENFTLDGTTKSSQENPYMFIPASAETKDFVVTASVDGKTYNSSVTMKEAFAKGKMYSVSLKMTNVGLTVSEVTLVDWDEVRLDEGTFQPGQDEALTANVYAVRKGDEALLLPGNIDTDKEEYIGIVLHIKAKDLKQKFLIKKEIYYAEFDSPDPRYPYYDEFHSISIPNYKYVINDISNTYFSSLPSDISVWDNGGLSDFEGKTNTKIINEDAYNAWRLTYNSTQNLNFKQDGEDDDYYWYVPALGQLALIYMNLSEINAVRAKLGMEIIDYNCYISSTEQSLSMCWCLDFYDGYVSSFGKDYGNAVLMIHDID